MGQCNYGKYIRYCMIANVICGLFMPITLFNFIRNNGKIYKDTVKYFLLLLFLFSPIKAIAQDRFNETKKTSFSYESFPVLVVIEGYDNFDLDVIYSNNDLLFVNVEDLFRKLGIPCMASEQGDGLAGLIKDESNTYL